jgi:hypothetical protein
MSGQGWMAQSRLTHKRHVQHSIDLYFEIGAPMKKHQRITSQISRAFKTGQLIDGRWNLL